MRLASPDCPRISPSRMKVGTAVNVKLLKTFQVALPSTLKFPANSKCSTASPVAPISTPSIEPVSSPNAMMAMIVTVSMAQAASLTSTVADSGVDWPSSAWSRSASVRTAMASASSASEPGISIIHGHSSRSAT